MANDTISFVNSTEQLIKFKSAEAESKYSYVVAIATVTWLLLSCISACIFCCHYWAPLKTSAAVQQEQQSEASELSELDQHSLLLTQTEDASSV